MFGNIFSKNIQIFFKFLSFFREKYLSSVEFGQIIIEKRKLENLKKKKKKQEN
jgi:hypothetical protein